MPTVQWSERLAGQHRIAAHGVFVVLNRLTPNRMTSEEWHKAASSLLGRPFPPSVRIEIVDVSLVGELQDRKRIPFIASGFLCVLPPLANALFSTSGRRHPRAKSTIRSEKLAHQTFRG